MIKRVGKRGDTLIEVMIAVGIFSMVAIAVVAVMNGGTSSAQTSLEATLAREEIDMQAEALRFIQSAYIAEKGSSDERYGELWRSITDRALEGELGKFTEAQLGILEKQPEVCDDAYGNGKEATEYGFVLNPRVLGTFADVDEVIFSGDKLARAVTYPHLVFESEDGNNNEGLVSYDNKDVLFRAEGIYIIAVKDPGATNIIDDTGSNNSKTSAYYDFYIRTCWYGTGDQNASTISTLIRLYDPEIIKND